MKEDALKIAGALKLRTTELCEREPGSHYMNI